MAKGKFITFEGPDGSGKSSIMRLVEEYLKDNKIDYIATREPGGTDISEKIRNLILDENNKEMTSETEALLYAASRSQHTLEKIIPNLDKGKHVLSDRYLLSSLAYQGVGRGLGIEEVQMINDFATKSIRPDLILFFHISPELTLKRKTIGGGDRLEQEGIDFHKKVYNGYLEIIKKYPENIKIIDASQPIEDVFIQVINKIGEIL